MEKDPVDHLLLSLYEEFGWGNPYEKEVDPDTSEKMTDMGLLPQRYSTGQLIESKDKNCHFNGVEHWPDNLLDLLGEYIVKKYDEEGKIYLYEDCINKAGQMYYDEIGYKFKRGRQHYVNIVREIVLWHELGHWITHWMTGNDNCRWTITSSYVYDKTTKDVHEGLAQAFTFYAIIKIDDQIQRNNYLQVFNYLLRNQASFYHKHYEIMNHPNFSWKGLLRGITMLRIKENSNDVTIESLLKEMGH